jgi:NADH-quinone oxidoreductase subunit J
MEAVIFYALAAIILISAICVVFLRRPMHNVLFMIIVMVGLAAMFILLHAEFIGMVQLVVYAGAVMVLFLFVIMLLNLDQIRLPNDPRQARTWIGVSMALILLFFLFPVLRSFIPAGNAQNPAADVSNTEVIARELFTTYLLPFEIASVLLLAAIIGTVLLAQKRS